MSFKVNNILCSKMNGCFISHCNGVLIEQQVTPSPTENEIICIDNIIIDDLIDINNTETSSDDIDKIDGIALSDSVIIEIA